MGRTTKIAHFGAIFFFNTIFKGIVEWVLIPLSMKELGFLKTFIFTNLFLLSLGFFSIKLYDYYGKDCLSLENLKKSQDNKIEVEKGNNLINMILKWADKNPFLLSLFLSSQNPALTVLYYRYGHNLYNGFTGRKLILIFLRNILILSLYINTLLYLGLKVFK